jgi:hypothetical protein
LIQLVEGIICHRLNLSPLAGALLLADSSLFVFIPYHVAIRLQGGFGLLYCYLFGGPWRTP